MLNALSLATDDVELLNPAGFKTPASEVLALAIASGNVVCPDVKSCAPEIDVIIGIKPVGFCPAVILSEMRPPQPVNACVFEMLVCDCVT